jgi:hypothetical protein
MDPGWRLRITEGDNTGKQKFDNNWGTGTNFVEQEFKRTTWSHLLPLICLKGSTLLQHKLTTDCHYEGDWCNQTNLKVKHL